MDAGHEYMQPDEDQPDEDQPDEDQQDGAGSDWL
jgi:hypothetical protein